MLINITVKNQYTSIKAIQFIERDLDVSFAGVTNVKENRTTLKFLYTGEKDMSCFFKSRLNTITDNYYNKRQDLYSKNYLKVVAYGIMKDNIVIG